MMDFFDLLVETVTSPGLQGTTTRWGLTAGLVLMSWTLLGLVKRVVVGRLRTFAEHPRLGALAELAEVVDRTNAALYVAGGLAVGHALFPFRESASRTLATVATVLMFVQIGFWATQAVRIGVDRYRDRLDDPAEHQAALGFLAFVGRVIVWAIVVLVVLENIGFDVTTLVAGLGIGGIAIALAAQNILGDLFASLSLIIDKPFVPGDFIIVGDMMGVVQDIGLKTTRLRSLGGEQLIFSNADLLSTRVRNYQRLEERRVNFQFGIVYQTPTEQVTELPETVQQIIESTDGVRFERAHLKNFGDSAFEYEVIYWILDPDYAFYMDRQQEILVDLLEALRDRDIDLAYPTRTVYVDDTEGAVVQENA